MIQLNLITLHNLLTYLLYKRCFKRAKRLKNMLKGCVVSFGRNDINHNDINCALVQVD